MISTSASETFAPPVIVDSRHGVFRYVDETHTYYLGEKILPSITGILKVCGYIDTAWYTEEARNRGSHVHKAIHFLNKKTLDWSTVIDAYLGYVMAYEKFRKDWNFVVTKHELPMYHPDLLFGGTPDAVGRVLDNVPAIIELKTGKVMKWAALQTAGQELLVRAWEPTKLIRYRRWGVTLNADGTYSKPIEFTQDRDETVFRMLNTAVQELGPKTETVFRALGTLTPIELKAVGVNPTLESVIQYREQYAA